jgi:PEP-CTERM motif
MMFKRGFESPIGRAWVVLAAAIVGVALIATVTPAQADTFNLTSCHISTGCPTPGTIFGTVTLTQSGTSVNFDVELLNGTRFVETGSGGGELFLFNDSLAGSTITGITATLNGANVAIPGGLSGFTNISPPVMADGTGTFTASVECTTASSCNGGSTPNINDLHFTVTNATIAQLTTGAGVNAAGNIFVADILCGATVTGCAGQTGPVDVTGGAAVPEPATIAFLGTGLIALGFMFRRRQVQR